MSNRKILYQITLNKGDFDKALTDPQKMTLLALTEDGDTVSLRISPLIIRSIGPSDTYLILTFNQDNRDLPDFVGISPNSSKALPLMKVQGKLAIDADYRVEFDVDTLELRIYTNDPLS